MSDPDLFGFVAEQAPQKTRRARVVPGWHLVDHVCRLCFGRIVVRVIDGVEGSMCCECGAEAPNRGHIALCCCGTTFRTGEPAGLRCRRNHRQTPEVPALIVVGYADDAAPQQES